MKKVKKKTLGIDWDAIFQRRPDLAPPGYHEVIATLYPKETEQND